MIPSSQDNLRRPSQSPYLYCAPLGLNKAVKLSGMPTPNLKITSLRPSSKHSRTHQVEERRFSAA